MANQSTNSGKLTVHEIIDKTFSSTRSAFIGRTERSLKVAGCAELPPITNQCLP